MFDEFIYDPDGIPPAPQGSQHASQTSSQPKVNTAFEIPLNTLVECLNVFGTAGPSNHNSANTQPKVRRWRKIGEGPDNEQNAEGPDRRRRQDSTADSDAPANNSRIDQYFGKDKEAGLRLSYAGTGYPFTFTM